MNIKLGLSTGCFYKLYENTELTDDLLNFYLDNEIELIELNILKAKKCEKLYSLSKKLLTRFECVSLHAPSDITYRDDEQTNIILSNISNFSKLHNISSVIVHPDKIVDFSVFKKYPETCFLYENMDKRKSAFRLLSDLKAIGSHEKFVIDLQHLYTNHEKYASFQLFIKENINKIFEFHVSGYDAVSNHAPLHISKNASIIKMLKWLSRFSHRIPTIIESVFSDKNQILREYEFIKSLLLN